MNEIDITIIGGGTGGYTSAIYAAHLGAKVALIEENKLGGTCLNRGCIPTKVMAKSAEVLSEAKKAGDFGIEANNVAVNFPRLMANKDRVVNELFLNIEQLIRQNKIALYRGTGQLISPHKVKVNSEEITTKKIIIATGSETASLPVPGSNLDNVLTTDSLLELKELPKSLIVIGGNVLGAEFASIFKTLGTDVTVVEQRPFLLETVDNEVRLRFTQLISRQNIKVITGAKVSAIKKSGDELAVVCGEGTESREIKGQIVLMATGRHPFTKNLALSELKIDMNGRAIKVDGKLKTNVEDIYAIGDVTGINMMAHVASYQGEIAVDNALGRSKIADYNAVPTCVFTLPEIACVGITEQEAKRIGIPYKVSKFPFSACGRAVAINEINGIVKMICSQEDNKVLGIHILGHHASCLIAECTLAINLRATAADIASTIHAHPTLSEAIHETAMGQISGAIHFNVNRF